MGNAIKCAVKSTLSFFRKVKEVICDVFSVVATVVIKGVKTVVKYFKKIIEYVWNGIKIVGKLLYVGGKKLMHFLSNKLGISYLIQFFVELKTKRVRILDEKTNKDIDPISALNHLQNQMKTNDQVKIGIQMIHNETIVEEEKSTRDFKEKDDLEGIGLQQRDSVAVISERESEREINLNNLSRLNLLRSDAYYPKCYY